LGKKVKKAPKEGGFHPNAHKRKKVHLCQDMTLLPEKAKEKAQRWVKEKKPIRKERIHSNWVRRRISEGSPSPFYS